MTTPRNARMLTRYNAWADKLILDAAAKLPEGEAFKPRKSVFKNIVHTLNHNYPGGHPNSSTRGHPKLLHPEQM